MHLFTKLLDRQGSFADIHLLHATSGGEKRKKGISGGAPGKGLPCRVPQTLCPLHSCS